MNTQICNAFVEFSGCKKIYISVDWAPSVHYDGTCNSTSMYYIVVLYDYVGNMFGEKMSATKGGALHYFLHNL